MQLARSFFNVMVKTFGLKPVFAFMWAITVLIMTLLVFIVFGPGWAIFVFVLWVAGGVVVYRRYFSGSLPEDNDSAD